MQRSDSFIWNDYHAMNGLMWETDVHDQRKSMIIFRQTDSIRRQMMEVKTHEKNHIHIDKQTGGEHSGKIQNSVDQKDMRIKIV